MAVKGQQTDPEGTGQSYGCKGSGDDEGGRADKDQPLEIMTMGARWGASATAKPSRSRMVWFRAVDLLAYKWQRPTDPVTLVSYCA